MNNSPGNDKSISIALCDDHQLIRDGLCSLITMLGNFSVTILAGSCDELITKATAAYSQPDIYIVDINMRPKNGWETSTEIRQKWPLAKVLFLTLLKINDIADNLIKYEADGYLPKNCTTEELREALLRIHSGKPYFSPAVAKILQARRSQHARPLTENEITFLKYCGQDLTYTEIARLMFVSPRTIDNYRDSLFQKLNVKTKSGLILYAVKAGIISIFEQ